MPDVCLPPPTHTDGHDRVNNSRVIPRPHVAWHCVPCLLRMNSLLPTRVSGMALLLPHAPEEETEAQRDRHWSLVTARRVEGSQPSAPPLSCHSVTRPVCLSPSRVDTSLWVQPTAPAHRQRLPTACFSLSPPPPPPRCLSASLSGALETGMSPVALPLHHSAPLCPQRPQAMGPRTFD